MKHTYINKKGDKLVVVISEEKVPEKEEFGILEFSFKEAVLDWLSKSTTYEVYPDQEEKFNHFIMEDQELTETELPEFFEYMKGFVQIPNEAVETKLGFKFNEGSYYNFCSICKEKFIGAKKQPACESCCHKEYAFFVQPEEKDLWPSDEKLLEISDEYAKQESVHDSKYYFHTCAKYLINQLKKDYILTRKSK